MALLVAASASASLGGCPGAVDPTLVRDGAAPVDSAADQASSDAGPLADQAGDARPDLPGGGEGLVDLGFDLPPPDLSPPPPCVDRPDADTVALYTFEGTGSTVDDLLGNNPGQIRGNASRSSGKGGCGQAVAFAAGAGDSYVEIGDAPTWALAEGAVDLWVRFEPLATVEDRGILSRDANGTALPGHFTISRHCDGAIVVRHQLDDVSYYQCSAPVPDDVWLHVGVNFGAAGLELYVDGTKASRTDAIRQGSGGQCVGGSALCGTPSHGGIAGNNNPWVVGASAALSDEGKATPVAQPLGGAVDSLRFSSQRRTF